MKRLLTVGVLCLLCVQLLQAQKPITQFDLSASITSPSQMHFAEAGNGDIWFMYRYTENAKPFVGFIVYDGISWTRISPSFCDACGRDISVGPGGKIYVAGSESGTYRWDEGSWTQISPITSYALAYDGEGTLNCLTSSGVLKYDGAQVVEMTNAGTPPSDVSSATHMLAEKYGRVWVLMPSALYSHDDPTGWIAHTQNDNPSHMAMAPLSRLWLLDAAGNIREYKGGVYYDDISYGNDVPIGAGLTDFAVDGEWAMWAGTQGTSPGVVSHGSGITHTYLANDLIPGSILIDRIFITSHDDVWVATTGRTSVAKIGEVTTSIIDSEQEFEFYPNLAQQSLTLKAPSNVVPMTWKIGTPTGQTIASGSMFSGETIELPALPSGVYFLQAKQDGKEYSQKFVWLNN